MAYRISDSVALTLVLCWVWCSAVRAEGPGDWLNVKDAGASGSRFETAAKTTAGSAQITVQDVGDFQVGQGVMLSRAHPYITNDRLWGPKTTYGAKSGRSLKGLIESRVDLWRSCLVEGNLTSRGATAAETGGAKK